MTKDKGQRTAPKITDFGLAKRLDRDSDQTKTGAVLGTPSFMAPEQAAGPSRELTTSADIYALGATLYACLTGRPPFQAATALETIEQVKSKEPVAPRLLQPTLPRDLETICLKSLAKEPKARYATAADLADDLQRYLDGKPIVARPIGRAARLLRWCLRNPAVSGLAAALAVLLPAALITVTVLYFRAEQQRAAAAASAARAEQKSELARTTVDEMLLGLGNSLVDTQDIPKVRRAMYDKALVLYRRFAEEPGGTTPEVRRGVGRLLVRRASTDRDTGRLSEARDGFREAEAMLRPLVKERPDDAVARKTLAEALQALGQLLRKTGDGAGAAAAFREAADLFDPTSQGYKTSLNNLSIVLMESGQAEPALAALKELVDRQRRTLAASPNDPATAGWLGLYLTNCALTQNQLGRRAEAAESLRESIALYERSMAAVPKAPSYRVGLADGYLNLGGVLTNLEKFDEAIAAYRRAIELRTPLAADFPNLPGHRHRLAAAHTELAGVLTLAGRLTEVDREIERALVILERLVAESPKVPEYRTTLSSALGNRGTALRRSGKPGDALPWLDRSIALVEGQQALLADPENRHNLAHGYHSRARALATLGRHDEAIRDWDKAMPLAAEKDRKEMESDRAKSAGRQVTP